LAQEEYDHFRIEQDSNNVSDFEKDAKRIMKGRK
jgi:hypothetical protein